MRRILLSTIKILISVALLYFALRKADLSNLASRIDIASLGWIGLAIVVTFLQVFIGALRWREISADCDAGLATTQAIRFNLIGSFFNQTLPSSIPRLLATSPRASRLPKVLLVALEQLVERVMQLSLEVEKCEMDARADRVSLHFSLHGHLLPHHHLFLHHHFLLHLGLTSCRESAGVGTLHRRRLARFGSPDIGIGRSDVQPGMSRRGREKNSCNQEKLAHRRLHLMMATVSPIRA